MITELALFFIVLMLLLVAYFYIKEQNRLKGLEFIAHKDNEQERHIHFDCAFLPERTTEDQINWRKVFRKGSGYKYYKGKTHTTIYRLKDGESWCIHNVGFAEFKEKYDKQ
jgi:hypothetical protein